MKLCRLTKPLIHTTNAASLGCYDLMKNKFSCDFYVDIITDYHIAGKYKGIPVSVAIGDNQASVLSSLADKDNILLNIGTGSQVSVISNVPIVAENIETRPYFEGKYLVVGAALCGGRAYSMLKNFYSDVFKYVGNADENRVYDIMGKMIESIDESTLTVDTRFAGTRSNKELCGSISGITTDNFTPPHLTLGILQGMSGELYEMYKSMNLQRNGIVGSGNGVRKNPHLVKSLEKAFGSKMKMPKHLEEASVGFRTTAST